MYLVEGRVEYYVKRETQKSKRKFIISNGHLPLSSFVALSFLLFPRISCGSPLYTCMFALMS